MSNETRERDIAGVCRWRRVGVNRQFTRQGIAKPGHEHPAEQRTGEV